MLTLMAVLVMLSSSQEVSTSRVGELGRFDRVEVRGATAFTPEQIRDGLAGDPQLFLLSHPRAPRETFLELVAEQLRAGYLRSGFPDASVSLEVDPDSGRVIAEVSEGPRVLAGEVSVSGLEDAESEQFVTFVTEPLVPRTVDPRGRHWPVGEPAPLDPVAIDYLRERVTAFFRSGGWFDARFEVAVTPDGAAGIATLDVMLEEIGPRYRIAAVDVRGLQRIDRELFLAFLEVQEGEIASSEVLEHVHERLRSSARFFRVAAGYQGMEQDGACRLQVEVEEFREAPPLGEPLPPEVETALRFGDWLEHRWRTGEEEVVVTATVPLGSRTFELELVTGGPSGIALGLASTPGTRGACEVIVTPEMAAWCSDSSAAPLLLSAGKVRGFFGVQLFALEQDAERPFMMNFQFGARGGARASSSDLFELGFEAEPTSFVHLARLASTTEVGAEVVHYTYDNGSHVELETDSGRPRSIRWLPSELFDRVEIRAARGELERRRARLQSLSASEETETREGTGDLARDLVLALLEDKLPGEAARREVMAEQIAGLVTSATSKLLVGFFGESATEDAAAFVVPTPVSAGSTQLFLAQGAMRGRRFLESRFPLESWPVTVSRETTAVLLGQDGTVGPELERLYRSSTTGPLGCLVIAGLLDLADQPQLRRAFARKGLASLDASGLGPDAAVIQEVTEYVVQGVVSLEQGDLLLALLPEAVRARWSDSAPEGGSEPILREPVVRQLWAALLEVGLRSSLEALAREE